MGAFGSRRIRILAGRALEQGLRGQLWGDIKGGFESLCARPQCVRACVWRGRGEQGREAGMRAGGAAGRSRRAQVRFASRKGAGEGGREKPQTERGARSPRSEQGAGCGFGVTIGQWETMGPSGN